MQMIRHIDGHAWLHEQKVLQPICGRGMDQLLLDRRDIQDLRSLTAEQLAHWLEQIEARFPDA
jgi:predicted transcriptional regulator